MMKVKDKFLKKAIQLVIDGTEVSTLKEILDTEITYLEERHKKGIDFFRQGINEIDDYETSYQILKEIIKPAETGTNEKV